MTKISRPPREEDYFYAASKLDVDFRNASINRVTVDRLDRLPQARPYMARAAQWGMVIEPVDQFMAIVDPRRTGANIFGRGSAVGLVLADQVHRGDVKASELLKYFDTLPFESVTDDIDERQIAQDLKGLSDRGLAAMGHGARRMIRGWEAQYVVGEEKRTMFRRGIGLTALLASHVHMLKFDVQELERQMEQAEAGTIDWDAGLRGPGNTA